MATEVERLIVTLEARLGDYQRQLVQGQRATETALRRIDQRFAQTASSVRSSTLSMGAALGTLGTYLTVDQVVGYANAWLRVTRGLEGTEETFQIALLNASKLNDLASEARVDLESYVKLYQRTAIAIKGYGFEAGTAEKVTSTLAKALKLGGAAASEQASVLLQFSQALQKGKLDGDEFRSVMENAGIVQELLAKRLRVSKAELLDMAAAGKLQIQDLVGAMVDGAAQIDQLYGRLPATIDESFAVLNNRITEFIGKMDATYGITQSVTGALNFLSENIDTVGKAALAAGVGLLAMFAPAIIGGIAALGVAAATAAGTVGLIAGGTGAATAALALFSDQIALTNDGVITLKDTVSALASELADLTEEEGKLQGFAAGFSEQYGASFAERVRNRARQNALGRGFAENTTVEKAFPDPKPVKPPVDEDAERRRARFEREYDQAARQIDQANASAAAVGRSAFETERLAKKQELLTAAREAGIKVTTDELTKIDAISVGYARAVTEAEALRAAYEDIAASSKDALSGFIRDMRDGASASEALAGVLDRISDKLIDMAVNDLVEGALGGLSGRGGNAQNGLFASAVSTLFGGGSGGWSTTVTPFAKGGIAAHGQEMQLPMFANGGISRSAAIFGEAGPEAAVPLPDGRRIPVDLRVPTANAAPAAPSITVAPVFQVQNGTPEGVKAMERDTLPKIRQIVQAEIANTFDRSARFSRSGI